MYNISRMKAEAVNSWQHRSPSNKKGVITMTKNKTTETTNLFDLSAETNNTENQSQDFGPELIGLSRSRAANLMLTVSKDPELQALGARMLQGDPADLIELIGKVYDDEAIKADSILLDGATEEHLSSLLESRRSERSKTKKTLATAKDIKKYIAAMYAELLIREYWQKPYSSTSSGIVVDVNDLDTVNRKIASLRSKKSRLKKLAAYEPAAAEELETIESELDELTALRPTTKTVTKTIIKDASVEQVRDALKLIDSSKLSEEEQAKLQDLMAKLG